MMDDVAAHTTAPFVGRDAELDELVSWLGGDARRGGRSRSRPTVLLSGDAGVGKTRLLTEVRDRLAADGWRVVAGHCLDLGDSALPYLPFSEILGRLATELPEVVADGRRPPPHPGPAPARPPHPRRREPATAPRSTVPRSSRPSAPCSTRPPPRGRCSSSSRTAHWADQSTRDLITFLFARDAAAPCLAGRQLSRRRPPPPPPAPSPPRRVVTPERRTTPRARAAERRLPCTQLIAELVPGGLAMDETVDIVDRAEGNAFFVEELTSAAAGPGRWVPAELADVLLVRLDRLDDHGPPGGPDRERGRPQGLPRAARRRLRPRPAPRSTRGCGRPSR